MPNYKNHPLHSEVLRLTMEKIKGKMYRRIANFEIKAMVSKEPIPFDRRNEGKVISLREGDKWGELWDCAWFFLTAVIPDEAKGQTLVAKIDISGEALLFSEDGCPIKGFTSVKSKMTDTIGMMGKTVYPVEGKVGDKISLTLDAGNNDLFGKYCGGVVREAHLAVCREQMRALFYDYAVLYGLMNVISTDRAFHFRIKAALSEVERALTDYTEAEAACCRKILKPVLEVESADTGFDVSFLGHAHLDLAWMWPLRETWRKGARTFSTALHQLNRYPSYVFGASQAQLYEMVKNEYPKLFEKIKPLVADGRWEIQGGMWVECDLNATGAESLVRQFLFGQAFFQKNFGKKSTVCWLPDTFGFTGALPQLMKSAGMERFVTQKIRTAPNFIDYPHDTFFWEGIDGSRVLTHVAPFENYGSSGSPQEVALCEIRFRDKMYCNSALLLTGQSDGGGGAGAESLEAYEREKLIEGLPRCEFRTAEHFFNRIETGMEHYETWRGSMDLDMHTGSLTSSGRSKKNNKDMEIKLHIVEWFLTAGAEPIKKRRLNEMWKRVLLFQFHDILPGTSIQRVYDESHGEYQDMLWELDSAIDRATNKAIQNNRNKNGVTVWNSAPVAADCFINVGNDVIWVNQPPYSVAYYDPTKEKPDLKLSENTMENDILKVTFLADGSIGSVFHKKLRRELIGDYANRLCIYHDIMNYNEDWGVESAWDIPIRYKDKAPEYPCAGDMRFYMEGFRAVAETVYKFHDSTIVQRAVLCARSSRIDFETEVDWREQRKMLRSITDCTVFATQATRGIQFGCEKINLNKNTVWDYAMFERNAHRYVDISESTFGVALLLREKYGVRLQDRHLDLCLLRSSGYPAEKLDFGKHSFVYALYFHEGDVTEGRVLQEALRMEYAPIVHRGVMKNGALLSAVPEQLLKTVIIETVKTSEDGQGMILRIYEPYGRHVTEDLRFDANPILYLTDILEEKREAVELSDNIVRLEFRPFEIKTLLVGKQYGKEM